MFILEKGPLHQSPGQGYHMVRRESYLERGRGFSASRHPTLPMSGSPQLPSEEVRGELLKWNVASLF